MRNKQEIWTAMVIGVYAKRRELPISEAASLLLDSGCVDYLEECYGALHQLSNDDVVRELSDMAKRGRSR